MKSKRYKLSVPAETERLPELLSFVEEHLEAAGCSMKAQMQIAVAAEEIFVNISHYAYAPGTGSAEVRMELFDDPARMTLRFIDSGRPFDPLAKPDPDVSLPADERDIGGLGIYMTKKFMDAVSYERRDGENVLTIQKKL